MTAYTYPQWMIFKYGLGGRLGQIRKETEYVMGQDGDEEKGRVCVYFRYHIVDRSLSSQGHSLFRARQFYHRQPETHV